MYPSIPDEVTVLRGPFVTGFSDDEFFRFCQENDQARIERTANHEIIIMPPAGFESSYSTGQAFGSLLIWHRQYRQGRVLESSVGYLLSDGAVLSPRCLVGEPGAAGQRHGRAAPEISPAVPRFRHRNKVAVRPHSHPASQNGAVAAQRCPAGLPHRYGNRNGLRVRARPGSASRTRVRQRVERRARAAWFSAGFAGAAASVVKRLFAG